MLARWRADDVFHETVRRRKGRPPWIFYEGPPTANGRPGTHHVLARIFKDIFPRYRTMCGYYVERKGGWDCHGLPVELAVEEQLGFTSKDDIERYGIAEFNAKCRESVFTLRRGVGAADGADRLLGRPRRGLPHARRLLHRVRLVGAADDLGQGPAVRGPQGRPVLPALRHRAVLARAGPAGRVQRRDRPLRLRALAGDEAGRAAAGRRRAARVDDDAVDARLERGGRGRPRADLRARARPTTASVLVLAEALVERVLGDGRRPARALRRRRRSLGAAYEPPFPFIPGSAYGEKGHTVLPARLRHRRGRHRPRPHRDRVRRGRLPPRRAAGADGRQPGEARRHLRRAHRPLRRPRGARGERRPRRGPARARAAASASRTTSTPTRTAGAAARALLYYAKPSWYIRTSQIRDRLLASNETRQLAPAARQARALRQLAGGQRRLGAVARALLGHAAAGVALRAGPRPLRRLVRRAGGAVGRAAGGRAPARTSTRSASPASSAAGGCSACPR